MDLGSRNPQGPAHAVNAKPAKNSAGPLVFPGTHKRLQFVAALSDDQAALLMILSRVSGSNFFTKIKMLANANIGNTPAAIRTGK
jgi:hypothetical protein